MASEADTRVTTVRLPADLHRILAHSAYERHTSLNAVVIAALTAWLFPEAPDLLVDNVTEATMQTRHTETPLSETPQRHYQRHYHRRELVPDSVPKRYRCRDCGQALK